VKRNITHVLSLMTVLLLLTGTGENEIKPNSSVPQQPTETNIQSIDINETTPVNPDPTLLIEPATGEQINWITISYGGATQINSTNYYLGLTIGQNVSGMSDSPSYNLNLGFWQKFGDGTECCVMRGDVYIPNDGSVLVNDIVYLVDFLFRGGPAPDCFVEGDCATPLDNDILVNDIVFLIDFLFRGGVDPPPC